MSKQTDMRERHRKFEEMVSHKGEKHESVLGNNKYFIDCPYCSKRIEGNYDTIDNFYKHHLENYHQEHKHRDEIGRL